MLDLGWSELLIIGIAALIVVGPKDLPRMLRTLGQYAGKARGIAREFQRSMDEAARQADIEELKEVQKGLNDMRQAQYKMQRDMSQSFLDSPKKTEPEKTEPAKTGPAKAGPAKTGPAKTGEKAAQAKPAPPAETAKSVPAPEAAAPAKPKSAPKPKKPAAKAGGTDAA